MSRARLSPRVASKKLVRRLRYEGEKSGGDPDRRGWIKGKLEGGVDRGTFAKYIVSTDDEANFGSTNERDRCRSVATFECYERVIS